MLEEVKEEGMEIRRNEERIKCRKLDIL